MQCVHVEWLWYLINQATELDFHLQVDCCRFYIWVKGSNFLRFFEKEFIVITKRIPIVYLLSVLTRQAVFALAGAQIKMRWFDYHCYYIIELFLVLWLAAIYYSNIKHRCMKSIEFFFTRGRVCSRVRLNCWCPKNQSITDLLNTLLYFQNCRIQLTKKFYLLTYSLECIKNTHDDIYSAVRGYWICQFCSIRYYIQLQVTSRLCNLLNQCN